MHRNAVGADHGATGPYRCYFYVFGVGPAYFNVAGPLYQDSFSNNNSEYERALLSMDEPSVRSDSENTIRQKFRD